MARRGEMAEVELLEHDDASVPAVDDVDRARGVLRDRARGGLAWIRRHRVVSAGIVVAVAVGIAMPVAASARASAARAEVLAAMPGVLAPMTTAPRIAWTSDPAPGSFALSLPDRAWVRDGVLVVWEQTGDSAQTLRALDRRTGDELWTAALTTVPDLGDPQNRSTIDPTTCSAPAGRGVVVCLVPDGWRASTDENLAAETDDVVVEGDPAPTTTVEPSSLRLRAFDVATGEAVLDLPLTAHASFVPLDADVVVAQAAETSTGALTLVRLDPESGAQRWSVDIPRGDEGEGWRYPWVQPSGDGLAVSWKGSTFLYTADGEPDGVLDTSQVWLLRGHPWTSQPEDPSALTELATGRTIDTDDEFPAWVGTDDGSLPQLVVLADDAGLHVLDAETGGTAWKRPRSGGLDQSPLVIVDGRLGYVVDGALTVDDLRTGDEVWQEKASGLRGESLVTDGRHLIALEIGVHRSVVAFDLRDGRRAWAVEVPASVETLAVVDRQLFGLGADGIVGFERG